MIYSLNGKLLRKSPNSIVLDCGGVGFLVMIPTSVYSAVPECGESVFLYTYFHVKDDGLELYGFVDEAQRETFRLLIGVSGVGPKSALAILSLYDGDKIALAVAASDFKLFTACTGIGPKLAQRIVLELKDKVGALSGGGLDALAVANSATGASYAGSEAVAALTSLGFTGSEASLAVAKLDPSMATEELIAAALRSLASR
ncbi:MAG: Holliday junction branch migration protein RuvA [Oscillospiraceae bacterium]